MNRLSTIVFLKSLVSSSDVLCLNPGCVHAEFYSDTLNCYDFVGNIALRLGWKVAADEVYKDQYLFGALCDVDCYEDGQLKSATRFSKECGLSLEELRTLTDLHDAVICGRLKALENLKLFIEGLGHGCN